MITPKPTFDVSTYQQLQGWNKYLADRSRGELLHQRLEGSFGHLKESGHCFEDSQVCVPERDRWFNRVVKEPIHVKLKKYIFKPCPKTLPVTQETVWSSTL